MNVPMDRLIHANVQINEVPKSLQETKSTPKPKGRANFFCACICILAVLVGNRAGKFRGRSTL